MDPKSEDRRQHRRHDAVVQIVLRVELHGFDPVDQRFEACGRTRDVSRGGLYARVDRQIEPGGRVIAHFPDATGTLGRTILFGTVRRCVPRGAHWEVAVRFDTPLAELELSDRAAP